LSIELVGIGFTVGVLVGLTGVGGGSIMTPLLVLVMRVNPLVAVGSDLLYSVPTKLFGAYVHHRQRTVNWRIVALLLIGGVPAAIAGLALVAWLRTHTNEHALEHWTRRAIGSALVLAAAVIVFRPLLARSSAHAVEMRPLRRVLVASIGALVGFIVSITSIGSGSVTLPLLSLLLPSFALPELVGSDVAFAALLVPSAALGRWSMGDVDLRLVLNLLAGSLPGVYLGGKLCVFFSQRWLRPAVAVTLAFVGIRLI
jgi:uncharacterized membrane protein YfcA